MDKDLGIQVVFLRFSPEISDGPSNSLGLSI